MNFSHLVVDLKLGWDMILPVTLILSNTRYVCFVKQYVWFESELSLLIAQQNKSQLL